MEYFLPSHHPWLCFLQEEVPRGGVREAGGCRTVPSWSSRARTVKKISPLRFFLDFGSIFYALTKFVYSHVQINLVRKPIEICGCARGGRFHQHERWRVISENIRTHTKGNQNLDIIVVTG